MTPTPLPPPALPYYVSPIEHDGKKGLQILLDTRRPDCPTEVIFGMSDEGTNGVWLEYITLRLNRAFVNGWYGAQGVSSWPSEDYYRDADALWEKITGKSS